MLLKDFLQMRITLFFDEFHIHSQSREESRRITLFLILSSIGILFLSIFGTIDFIQGRYLITYIVIAVATILILNLLDFRKRKNIPFNIHIGISCVSLLYIYLYVTGGVHNSSFVWYFTYPLITCYLLGSKRGAIVSTTMTLPVVIMIFIRTESTFIAHYDLHFTIRFLAAYIVVSFFAYSFERNGEKNRKELHGLNMNLERTIKERTAELLEEIEDRKKAQTAAQLSKDSLTAIMDSIDSAIYVTDIKSCEILFINKKLKDLFKLDLSGKTSWKDLLKKNAPCDRCSNMLNINIHQTKPSIWEGINPVTHKWSINIDRTIHWVDGRGGHLHISTDISHLKELKDERKAIEVKLQRAQKMEAIGALAGGVAHDLNNVLTGIVSYPEMMLLNLDDDSPLRKPLMTMKQSGKKAAEIVQDLLTLARRGVNCKQLVNLNTIIFEYLHSPEYDTHMENYKDIKVTTHLDNNLLNVKGSPIHLRKTIMNLVVNATESQPNGGEIVLSTHNRNLKVPERLPKDIHEGDFIVLEITDQGIGIAPEEKNRIFEPFYTKKVMGKSGSGLGMAVVWGTVQDHHGYINVDSELALGTTFSLYFPAERNATIKVKNILPIETYMGRGESILVVDDMPEQLDLAMQILEALNYSVATVSSGEDAIKYLQNKTADLLILDMIMDPGIDGLETYKQILKIHPQQNAIIASGFSESKFVLEAQSLGAGQYIKKPYTVEIIGLTVKSALAKTH